jgi:hypothetical protein
MKRILMLYSILSLLLLLCCFRVYALAAKRVIQHSGAPPRFKQNGSPARVWVLLSTDQAQVKLLVVVKALTPKQ